MKNAQPQRRKTKNEYDALVSRYARAAEMRDREIDALKLRVSELSRERAAVVRYLRSDRAAVALSEDQLADAIERGDHLTEPTT